MGDAGASRETLGRAFRLAQRSDDADALGRAALGFCGFDWDRHRGGAGEAINLLRSAIAKPGMAEPLRARLLAKLAATLQPTRHDEAEELSIEAVEVASASGDKEALAAALIGRWHAVSGPESTKARADLTRELQALAQKIHNRDLELQASTLKVIVLLELGNFAEIDVAIAEHAQLADRMKQPLAQIRSRSFRAMRALLEGRFAEAERLVGAILELGASAHPSSAIELSVIELYAVYLETGRLNELEEPVRNLAAANEATPAWQIALAYLLSELGRTDEAGGLLEELGADEFDQIPRDVTELGALAFLAMTAVNLGDLERMEQLHERLMPFRGRPVMIGYAAAYAGNSSHYLGLLAAELGRRDDAVAFFEEAAEMSERAGALPWLARSRYELTRIVAARASNGDAEQAGELLAEASRTAERLGMATLLRRMDSAGATTSDSRR